MHSFIKQNAVSAKRANAVGINRIMVSSSQEVITLLYATLVKPQLEYGVHFWLPQYKKEKMLKN